MEQAVPTDVDAPSPTGQTIGGRDATRVAIASAIAAGSSLIVLLVQARVLTIAASGVFQAYWAALFACFGIMTGMQIETTRAVTASASLDPEVQRFKKHPRVLAIGVGIGAIVGIVLAASASLWGSHLFLTDSWLLGIFLATGVAGFAVHSVLVGALAGRRSWRTYSWLIGAESSTRLVLVLLGGLLGVHLLGMAGGAAFATFTWVLFLFFSPAARRAGQTRVDSTLGVFARRLASASVASGSSALLVVGFPVLLKLTSSSAVMEAAAPLLMAATLTRAPLMIPLNAYQGVAVTHFVQHRDRGLRAMLPAARAVVGVGVIAAVAAALLGPWLMRTVLGPAYIISGVVLGALTLAAVLLALLTLTGALCQALKMHGVFVAGWVTAVVVAIGILLTPASAEVRAVLALGVGPLVGIVVHLFFLRRRATSPEAVDASSESSTEEKLAGTATGVTELSDVAPGEPRPSVSVCMATYNGERFIEEQLRSILDQLGDSDEVVIVDDASQDETVAKIRAIDDPRIRLIVSPSNNGYVRTFESAMSHARGDIILLSDQDDVWTPDHVLAMKEALRTTDVVATNLGTLDGPDSIRGPYGQSDWRLRAAGSKQHTRNIVGIWAGNRPYYGCAMGLRRSSLTTVLPFPELLTESHDLWIALYGNVSRSMSHVETRTVRRRFHEDNASPNKPRGPLAVVRSRTMLIRATGELRGRRRA